jgi:putative ABC transport system permease protein
MKKIRKLAAHGLRSLNRHRLRTMFMMLGTFVGVAALTLTVSIGRNTEEQVVESINRIFGASSIMLRGGGMRMSGGRRVVSGSTLTLEDLAAIARRVEGIEAWDPMLMVGGREVPVVWEGKTANVPVMGHSERAARVWNRGVSRGSFFTEQDVASSARVALVGESVARDLFGDVDPIGQQIRIGTVPFQVIGVLEARGVDPRGRDRDNEIMVPISTAMRRLQNAEYITGANLLVADGYDPDATVPGIAAVLRERHALAADAADDFHIFTPVQAQERMAAINRVFTVFLPLVAGVSIVVGGFVVANLMLMGVNERRAEIGLRKAVGARSRDVWMQFLVESALVTTSGGVLAVAAGAAALPLMGRLTAASGTMPWQAAGLGLAIALAVGLVAGVFPARRAASLDPVQTLR